MEVPPADHENWRLLITGRLNVDLKFLAAKILITRLKLNITLQPGEDALDYSARELRDFFVKTQHLPHAQQDLKAIFPGVIK